MIRSIRNLARSLMSSLKTFCRPDHLQGVCHLDRSEAERRDLRFYRLPFPRNRALLAVATLLGGLGIAAHAQTSIGSITITGSEQSASGVYDTGTATATINGYSVSLAYGQYSTPASIAAGLAALISKSTNCGNLPVFAHAVGATVYFYPKTGQTVTSSSFTIASNNPTAFPTPSFPIAEGPDGGLPPTPQITGLSLTQGPVGMGLTITGTNFGTGPSTFAYVTLNNTVMPIVIDSWTPSSIIVQVPAGASSGDIVVTVEFDSSAGAQFTVIDPFNCSNQ